MSSDAPFVDTSRLEPLKPTFFVSALYSALLCFVVAISGQSFASLESSSRAHRTVARHLHDASNFPGSCALMRADVSADGLENAAL
jgi:hypothetical protein